MWHYITLLILMFFTLGVAPPPSGARTVYTCTDQEGRIIFTDSPVQLAPCHPVTFEWTDASQEVVVREALSPSGDHPHSGPPDGHPFQDRHSQEGLLSALQSQDPMERQMALMELGPQALEAPELLSEFETLATQDSDPMVQMLATEMLKQFSHQE